MGLRSTYIIEPDYTSVTNDILQDRGSFEVDIGHTWYTAKSARAQRFVLTMKIEELTELKKFDSCAPNGVSVYGAVLADASTGGEPQKG